MRTGLVALLLWAIPCFCWAAPFDEPLAASVFGTALAFMGPRTLEPEKFSTLTVWGLRGLTSLDSSISAELTGSDLIIRQGGRQIFTAPAPGETDADGWGALIARAAAATAAYSPVVGQAGTEGVIRAFFDELFNHLDPYSRYVPPAAAETERNRRSGEAGLGVTLARARGGVIVRDVVPSSPGDAGGLRPGDRILAVDGQPVRGEDAASVEDWLRGAEGSDVQVTWRPARGRVRTATLERALVPPQTVTAQRIGEIVLIQVSGFSADTDDQFAAALDAGLSGHVVRGFVLDLRGNRGGLLRQAISATDEILPEGTIVTTAGRNPQASRVWRASAGADSAHGRPIVILVDGRTASAAEIMAAALEDNGRAVVVGSSTLGKGLVQTISPLPDGGELFLTWSRVLAPAGWPIQGLGVMPQICTSLGEDSLRTQLGSLANGQLGMAAALARHNAARAPLPIAEIVDLRNACPAAEGQDSDLSAAAFLFSHPAAYQAAIQSSVVPGVAAAQ